MSVAADTDTDNEMPDVALCPVCLEETTLESETQVACPACRHQFHESCISKCVRTSRNARCPWCRNDEAWTRYMADVPTFADIPMHAVYDIMNVASAGATLSYADVLSGYIVPARNPGWSVSQSNSTVFAPNAVFPSIDWMIHVVTVERADGDDAFVYGNAPSYSAVRSPAPS